MNNAHARDLPYFCIRNNDNMKKVAALFTASLTLLVTGCDKGDDPVTPETDATTGASIPSDGNDENGNGTAGDGKTLIVFFSRAGENWQVGTVERGNTAIMVDYMKEFTEADVFEIVTETAYPQGYNETLTVATNEKNGKARPNFKGKVENIEQYDNVFIGGNSNILASVVLGHDCYVAAGSTITDDVPALGLGIAREKQENKEDWVTKKNRLRGANYIKLDRRRSEV